MAKTLTYIAYLIVIGVIAFYLAGMFASATKIESGFVTFCVWALLIIVAHILLPPFKKPR